MDAGTALSIARDAHRGQRDRYGEPLIDHVERVAGDVPGPAGTLARIVKLADLGDHLRHARRPGEPPYGWAREKVREAGARHDHAPTAA
jgi:hypothetical protein